MWSEGVIGIPDAKDKKKYTKCHYWVKHYEEPSEEYGINRGKISKVWCGVKKVIFSDGTVRENSTVDYGCWTIK